MSLEEHMNASNSGKFEGGKMVYNATNDTSGEKTRKIFITLPHKSHSCATSLDLGCVFKAHAWKFNTKSIEHYLRKEGVTASSGAIDFILKCLQETATELLGGTIQQMYHRVEIYAKKDRQMTLVPLFSHRFIVQEHLIANTVRLETCGDLYRKMQLDIGAIDHPLFGRNLITNTKTKSAAEERQRMAQGAISSLLKLETLDDEILPDGNDLVRRMKQMVGSAVRELAKFDDPIEDDPQTHSIIDDTQTFRKRMKERQVTLRDVFNFLEIEVQRNPRSRYAHAFRALRHRT